MVLRIFFQDDACIAEICNFTDWSLHRYRWLPLESTLSRSATPHVIGCCPTIGFSEIQSATRSIVIHHVQKILVSLLLPWINYPYNWYRQRFVLGHPRTLLIWRRNFLLRHGPIVLDDFEYPCQAPLLNHLCCRYSLHFFLFFNMPDSLHSETAVDIDLSLVVSTLLFHVDHTMVVFQDHLLISYEWTLRLFCPTLLIIDAVILCSLDYWMLAHKLSTALSQYWNSSASILLIRKRLVLREGRLLRIGTVFILMCCRHPLTYFLSGNDDDRRRRGWVLHCELMFIMAVHFYL